MITMIILNDDFLLIIVQNLFLLLTSLHTSIAFNKSTGNWLLGFSQIPIKPKTVKLIENELLWNRSHSLIKRKDEPQQILPVLDWPSSSDDVCKHFIYENVHEPNTLYSPGWPGNYPNNTDCITVLKAPEDHILLLEFREKFHIEPSANCKNDYLEIRDGAFGYNQLLIQLCDRYFPSSITSTGRYLWLHFHSDENTEYNGFKIVYEFRRRPNPLIPEIETCRIDVSGNEGFIDVNDIPKDRTAVSQKFNLSLECMWVISVPKNWKIYLQFDKFNLAKPNDCDANFLDIFSDRTDIPSKDKNYCGSKADSVISRNNILIVRFFAEINSISSDFKALFTAFREKDTSSRCNDDEYDCEDATCIAAELRCNQNINCRFRWDEDECHVQKAMLFSSDHVVIVMSIFMLIIFGLCFVFFFRCVKKLLKDHQTIQEHIRQSREMRLDKLGQKSSSSSTHFVDMDAKKRTQSLATNVSNHSSCFMITNEKLTAACDTLSANNRQIIAKLDPNEVLHRELGGNHEETEDEEDGEEEEEEEEDEDENDTGCSIPEMCDSACQTRESLFNVDFVDDDDGNDGDVDEQLSRPHDNTYARIDEDSFRTVHRERSSDNLAPDIIVIH